MDISALVFRSLLKAGRGGHVSQDNFRDLFTDDVLETLFPRERADSFFRAMFGDPGEGSFDISFKFRGSSHDQLKFEFHLHQRPGKCLVCSLTYGLPGVFHRHPVIDIKGLVGDVEKLINGGAKCSEWKLGNTREISSDEHVVPLTIFLER